MPERLSGTLLDLDEASSDDFRFASIAGVQQIPSQVLELKNNMAAWHRLQPIPSVGAKFETGGLS